MTVASGNEREQGPATQGLRDPEVAPEAEAVVTISITGWDSSVFRRGRFEELIGHRSLGQIFTSHLETSALNRLLRPQTPLPLYERSAPELARQLLEDFRVSLLPGAAESDALEEQGTPIDSPAERKAGDLTVLVTAAGDATAYHALHLHLSPASPERSFEERVAAFKRELRPKIESLDLSGLIRGNLLARAQEHPPV